MTTIFQASSHQYLQIKYIFFFKFCCTMTAILPLVPKYFPGGAMTAISFSTYDHDLAPFHLYSYVLPWLFATYDCGLKPHHTEMFDKSSNRSSIMPPRLPNCNLTIHGITGSDCTYQWPMTFWPSTLLVYLSVVVQQPAPPPKKDDDCCLFACCACIWACICCCCS